MTGQECVTLVKEMRRTIKELRKQLKRESLGYCPEYEKARSDEELIDLFNHMGYADGDSGYFYRYFSYGEARRIQDLIRKALA